MMRNSSQKWCEAISALIAGRLGTSVACVSLDLHSQLLQGRMVMRTDRLIAERGAGKENHERELKVVRISFPTARTN